MKVVQKLARHSDPKLTFKTYARVFDEAELAAVNLLPNIGQSIMKNVPIGQTDIKQNGTGQLTPDNELKTTICAKKTIPPRGVECRNCKCA